MESLTPELQKLIGEIALKNGITNYEVDVNNSVAKDGDGFIGVLKGLSLIDKDNGEKLYFVLKKAPANENLRKQFPLRNCFLREIQVYEEIFSEFKKFQEEYNVPNPFTSVTKLYGYIDEEFKETLLLKNLKVAGYKLCRRQEPLDSNHLRLVFTEYAKFHALSHAMKKLEPERFQKLFELVRNNVMMGGGPKTEGSPPGPSADDFGMLFNATLEALKDRPREREAVELMKKDCFKYMMPDLNDGNMVICHGDCWSANLLFKYEDEDRPNVPTKVCFIDWQMAVAASPIHDISYSFYINAGKKDLLDYKKYLQLYHTALSETLTAFGLDPDQVYSLELLEKEFKEKSVMGFFMCLVMLQQTLNEGKAHNFEELVNEGKSLMDMNNRKYEMTDLFKQRMGDLVEFLVEQHFI